MQGDQRSPGIIPLAVKDAFSIIQEVLISTPPPKDLALSNCLLTYVRLSVSQTPSREFLLRVSYIEIYNEVRSTFFFYFFLIAHVYFRLFLTSVAHINMLMLPILLFIPKS